MNPNDRTRDLIPNYPEMDAAVNTPNGVWVEDENGVIVPRHPALLGHWSPLCNGDPADPQVVFVLDANGAPDVLEMWVED